MSGPSCKDLENHLIEHEILGVTSGGGGGGDLTIVGGLPVFNDPTRGNKQMSIARLPYEATKTGRSKNVYLRAGEGIALTKTGFRMPYAGTVCLATAQNDRNSTFTFRLRKNGALTNLYSLAVTAAQGAHDKAVNLDFFEGDLLEFYIDGTAYNPIVRIEVSWRP